MNDFTHECGCKVSYILDKNAGIRAISIDNVCEKHSEILKESYRMITHVVINEAIANGSGFIKTDTV